jgi:predicted aspartyl protease
MIKLFLVLIISLPLLFSNVNAQEFTIPVVKFSSGSSSLKIPIELDGNIILMRVSVNKSRPLKFIFDTGASASVVSPEIASELGLKSQGEVQGTATGGSITASIIEGVTFDVQGVEVSNQMIAAVSFGATPCFPFDGIIGFDFINSFVVELDYENKMMNLYDPRSYHNAGVGKRVTLMLEDRTPLVETQLTLASHAPVMARLQIDTGGDGTVILNSPFVVKHKLLSRRLKTIPDRGVGVGGEEARVLGRAKSIKIGQSVFANPLVSFSSPTEGSGEDENDGIIGGEILRRFKVILNYSRKEMILKSNRHINEPYDVAMTGIVLSAEKEDDCKAWKVTEVAKNSPASFAGIRAGDAITAVDGRAVSTIPSDEVEQLFRRPGRRVVLTIKRGGGVLQKKLTLRRLI